MVLDRDKVKELLDNSKIWESYEFADGNKGFDYYRNTNVDIELDDSGMFVCQLGTVGSSKYFLYSEMQHVIADDRELLVCGENQNFYIRIKKD